MNRRFYINVKILLLIFVAALYSCSKRRLDTETLISTSVDVKFVQSKSIFPIQQGDTFYIYLYKTDSLILKKSLIVPSDRITLPIGNYSVLILNEKFTGAQKQDISNYNNAKILVNTNGNNITENPDNIFCFSLDHFCVTRNTENKLLVDPVNLSKSIDYQLIIGGAIDSLKSCIVTQPSVAKGVVLYNKQLIYSEKDDLKTSFTANKENKYSGKLNMFGINKENNNLDLKFEFIDNKTQNSRINISTLINDDIDAKKVIMYVDITAVDMEIKAVLKSWIVVEDFINI